MKIAICTPVHGDTRAGFTFSLAELLIHTGRQRPELELATINTSCSNIAVGRERLLNRAVKWGADWVLWIDSDHDFPPDALIQLLDLGEPFVGCNYPRREQSARPCAGFNNAQFAWTTQDKAQRREIETVDWMGLGFALVSMRAIEAARKPLFTGGQSGEDVIFCNRLKAAGFPPKIDHRLSAAIGHIGLRRWTNADAIEQRQLRDVQGKPQIFQR